MQLFTKNMKRFGGSALFHPLYQIPSKCRGIPNLPNKLSFKRKKNEAKCSFHSQVILIYVVGLRLISLSTPVIIVGFDIIKL